MSLNHPLQLAQCPLHIVRHCVGHFHATPYQPLFLHLVNLRRSSHCQVALHRALMLQQAPLHTAPNQLLASHATLLSCQFPLLLYLGISPKISDLQSVPWCVILFATMVRHLASHWPLASHPTLGP